MGGKETLTWEEFLNACTTIEKLSENLDQDWKLGGNSEDVGGCYLRYTCVKPFSVVMSTGAESGLDMVESLSSSSTHSEMTEVPKNEVETELTSTFDAVNSLVKCEYHVLYSMSYSVPVLYFNISRSDGSLVQLDEVWSIFRGETSTKGDADMWNTLSQQDHPVLNVPFFTIHPCHTSSLMGSLWNNSQNSSVSYLITWLSLVGGRLGLNLANEFGKLLSQCELHIKKMTMGSS